MGAADAFNATAREKQGKQQKVMCYMSGTAGDISVGFQGA